jgi:hypothetical protein
MSIIIEEKTENRQKIKQKSAESKREFQGQKECPDVKREKRKTSKNA